jgi:hypothetical protein
LTVVRGPDSQNITVPARVASILDLMIAYDRADEDPEANANVEAN